MAQRTTKPIKIAAEMSRKDRLTGRISLTGNSRSKAMNITKRDWKFNVQKVTYLDKNGKRVTLVTSAKNIRTLRRACQGT